MNNNTPKNNNHEKQSLFNFPERFPIKVFGVQGDIFTDAVKSIIEQHVEAPDILSWQSNESSQGKYLAVSIIIMARNQAQLDAIYVDLSASEHVKMAL